MDPVFERFPELKQALKVFIKEVDLKISQVTRPPEEVILDDQDVQNFLKMSRRQTANIREAGLINYSKPCGKIYYTYKDVLDYANRNRAESNESKKESNDKVL